MAPNTVVLAPNALLAPLPRPSDVADLVVQMVPVLRRAKVGPASVCFNADALLRYSAQEIKAICKGEVECPAELKR